MFQQTAQPRSNLVQRSLRPLPDPVREPEDGRPLDELEADLLDRRARAEAKHWLGEFEGIDFTLAFLRAKREDTGRRTHRSAVDLGMPAITQPGKGAQ